MPELKLLIPREQLEATLERLSGEINRDYRGKNPLLIGILKGSFIFLADLIRRLEVPVEIDFVQLASYGMGTETSGRVRVKRGLSIPVRGRDVLVVEDIVDTGITVDFLLRYLKKRRPASLKLCALLDKPERRRVPVQIDYLGLTVPNKFLVGYGLDWGEKYRQLPEVWAVE